VNENDEFPAFLASGKYSKIEPSRNCISSAMNVGHPSNLARLVAMYGGVMDEKGIIHKAPDMDSMRNEMKAVSVNDTETKQAIADAWKAHRLLLEPHGAVGWAALQDYLGKKGKEEAYRLSVVLETAHPAKFPEQIREILDFDPELPPSLEGLEEKTEEYDHLAKDYAAFKSYLQENY
jgi:threonine synthase